MSRRSAPLADALAADLRARLRGEVRFGRGDRMLYSTDASNYRQVPIGVVLPRDVDDVLETVAVCRSYGVPILPRGAGTSLAGQACNVAVVLDFSKYLHGVLDIDPERRLARVLPGTVLDDLRSAAERHGLTFGPDPATHSHCTIGGMLGNNSCGVHSVMAGRTADNVSELEVLTYDGTRLRVGPTPDDRLAPLLEQGGRPAEIYAGLRSIRDRYQELVRERYPRIPRRVSGYNLDELLPERGFDLARALVGTEGTCAVVLEATLRLVPHSPGRALLVLGFPDIAAAADRVPEVLAHGPIGLEGIEEMLVQHATRSGFQADLSLFPEGGAWLFVEFGGEDDRVAAARARAAAVAIGGAAVVHEARQVQARAWALREAALGATTFVPGLPDSWPGWEDSAVPPGRLGEYLRALRGLFEAHGYHCSLYGHFGDGCVHVLAPFELATSEGIGRYRRFLDEAADLVVSFGGSLSGEHGDGQARSELLPRMFGEELVGAFREFKTVWDPEGRMNPGKVVEPLPITDGLRLGPGFAPARPPTRMAFARDDGSFGRAAMRCIGVGECRKTSTGMMCPSYMATREERFSTRGRARLLFEMLQGQAGWDWRDENVKEALDLCLACKACKHECPAGVDMAASKAEFLSHYYGGRLRPRAAYAMGLVFAWARLGSLAPGAANAVLGAPGPSRLLKRAAGIAAARDLPPLASPSFVRWYRRRGTHRPAGDPVVLWPDTFTNFFAPWIGKAAVSVLEDAGFRVEVPAAPVCCGRPLFDYGMLDLARALLRRTVGVLAPFASRETPIVGLEPSCLVTFRDELGELLPANDPAGRVAERAVLLSELLEGLDDWRPPALDRPVLVQGHCQQTAVIGLEAERRVLERCGTVPDVLDAGCCGMAGSFGFQAETCDVSIAVGERRLLPAIRAAPRDALIVADGFSCREQIRQGSGKRALHLAEALACAIAARPPV